MKRQGFTLAEVLITLTVIGVVAAVSIPTLLMNLENQQFKVAWKKAYAEFTQVMIKVKLDQGGHYKDFVGKPLTLFPELKKHYKVYKSGPNQGIYPYAMLNYKDLANRHLRRTYFDDGQMETHDGKFIAFENSSGPVIVWFDVNGFHKAPNTLGKDLYAARVLEDKIVPVGAPGSGIDDTSCSSNLVGYFTTAASGIGCSALYLRD